ncbi:HPP family protein [Streptomyces sp. NPDC048717]|uniref:HPP family protein n=1 Tax=Streptomyces sp. NPDC048717 TaxID=3154928 RepID=UPI00342F0302
MATQTPAPAPAPTVTPEAVTPPTNSPSPGGRYKKLLTSKAPARPKPATILTNTLAATLALTAIAGLGLLLHEPLLIPPLAASAALAYGAPVLPLSQPRSIIGGQLISALTGFAVLALLPSSTVTAAVAGALALTAMTLTRTNHSPAAATAIIVVLTQPSLGVFLGGLALTAVTLSLIAVLRAKIDPTTPAYPQYWW